MAKHPGWVRHIKRPVPPNRSDAYAPTLCGRADSGQYAYVVLERGAQIPSDENICLACAERHIEEHYLDGRSSEGTK